MAEFEEKFLVINWKYLKNAKDAKQQLLIDRLKRAVKYLQMHKIIPDNKYYVCNQDEPYAQKVIDIILNGENQKAVPVETEVSPHAQKIIDELEQERDKWKSECNMYSQAWQRELGGKVYNKTHFIDALVITTRAMKNKLEAFEEVAKKEFR